MESSQELKSQLSKPEEVKPEPSLPLGEGNPEPSLPLRVLKPEPSLPLRVLKLEPSLPLGEVKPEPSLPPDWRKEFSQKKKKHYFFNAKTKMSVWNLVDVIQEHNLHKHRNMESSTNLKNISLLEEKPGSEIDLILQTKILLEKLKPNQDQILPEKPKTNKNPIFIEKTKAKKNPEDKTKSNKELEVNNDLSNLEESDIQGKGQRLISCVQTKLLCDEIFDPPLYSVDCWLKT